MTSENSDNQALVSNNSASSNYRSIFKATSLFGGVKVYQIMIGIIKSKVIAILLGPVGVGFQGLFQSATTLIQSLTAMGISSSAVRDVSESYANGNQDRVNRVFSVVKRLVWITGFLGMLCVIAFSSQLSKSTFGSFDYTVPFIFLSITLLFDQLAVGHRVVLQGTRRLRALAMSSAVGSTVSLLVCIPLYYTLGIKGIVPTLILTSLSLLIVTWYYARKFPIQSVKITNREAFIEGKTLLKMGLSMSISSILVYASDYVIRWFIRVNGGVETVGLYSAGFTLMTSYTGMVFTAMSADYYPRLASVNKDNKECSRIINQQAEVAVLILAPLLTAMIVFMPYIIKLLYSPEFLPSTGYMKWATIGMMFKALSWSVSFSFIAKGEARLFLISETCANLYTLLLNIAGFYFGGITGLGVSFAVASFIYCLQVCIISYRRYQLNFIPAFIKSYSVQLFLVVICLVNVYIVSNRWCFYAIGILLIIMSSVYSLKILNERMGLFASIKRFSNRKF